MNAHWAPRALTAALKYVTGQSPDAPPSALYAALSSTSADPAGPGFTELTVANYARQPVSLAYGSDYLVLSSADVNFVNLGAGTYLGVGLFDDATAGGLWFWGDLSEAVDFDTGRTVTLVAGLIRAGLSG